METEHSRLEFREHHGELVAIKKLRVLTPETISKWHNEVGILEAIRGPDCVAKMLDSSAEHLSISLRRERGHSLDSYIYALTQKCILSRIATDAMWLDIASALAHIHFHQIVHDDVKPENITWDPTTRHAVLVDFGAAIMSDVNGAWPFNSSGTPSYAAPEYLSKQKGPAGDVFALGVTMVFARGYIALPRGDWFLPRVFDAGVDRDAMLAWLEGLELVRRRLSKKEPLLVRMLDSDSNRRISSASLFDWLSTRHG